MKCIGSQFINLKRRVTLCVRVWIEIILWKPFFIISQVTLCVRVWIEMTIL